MNILKKILIGGIILLFAGISFSSAISVDIKSITAYEEIEDDCGCGVVYKNDFALINELLNRLDFKIYLIKLRFRLIPNIVEKCNEISEIINSESPFCIFLEDIMESLEDLWDSLYGLKETLSNNPILYYICVYSAGFIFIISFDLYVIGMFLCGWNPYYPPLL